MSWKQLCYQKLKYNGYFPPELNNNCLNNAIILKVAKDQRNKKKTNLK